MTYESPDGHIHRLRTLLQSRFLAEPLAGLDGVAALLRQHPASASLATALFDTLATQIAPGTELHRALCHEAKAASLTNPPVHSLTDSSWQSIDEWTGAEWGLLGFLGRAYHGAALLVLVDAGDDPRFFPMVNRQRVGATAVGYPTLEEAQQVAAEHARALSMPPVPAGPSGGVDPDPLASWADDWQPDDVDY